MAERGGEVQQLRGVVRRPKHQHGWRAASAGVKPGGRAILEGQDKIGRAFAATKAGRWGSHAVCSSDTSEWLHSTIAPPDGSRQAYCTARVVGRAASTSLGGVPRALQRGRDCAGLE